MKSVANFLFTVVIFVAVWGVYSRVRRHTTHPAPAPLQMQPNSLGASSDASETPSSPFHCDGRTYCSQMTSCAEAKYFLEHCPDVKMDGDHDGIPCESQWCPNG